MLRKQSKKPWSESGLLLHVPSIMIWFGMGIQRRSVVNRNPTLGWFNLAKGTPRFFVLEIQVDSRNQDFSEYQWFHEPMDYMYQSQYSMYKWWLGRIFQWIALSENLQNLHISWANPWFQPIHWEPLWVKWKYSPISPGTYICDCPVILYSFIGFEWISDFWHLLTMR